jgi:DNA helicase IV
VPTDLSTDLIRETAHLDESRAALRAMREHTAALLDSDVAGDPFSAEALAKVLYRRMEQLLDDGTTPLFFGRIDHGDTGDYAGETFYVGRRHVADAAGEPMVVDWRAPVSVSFYRANAADRMGVDRRRRFGFVGGTLTSFEDENLAHGEVSGTSSQILTEEIERPRVGPMRDIVATIQPDQDALVRADLEDSICIQGAPGTGKTAVGLHRAAFLLFAHRERLRRTGVLVVGPNRAFLSYIAQVLPALGEVDVTQVTADDLVTSVRVRAVDAPDAARVKGDARMADVLRRALRAGIRRPAEALVVPDGASRLRLGAGELARIVDDVRREDLPYLTGRERVCVRVADRLRRQLEERGESPPDRWVQRLARSRPVRAFADKVWPMVDPAALVARVLANPTDDLLSADEQAAIRWAAPPKSFRTAKWTAADAVLIDEAAALIDRIPTYGHVIVDEAQDLSPMQCRAIGRRCTHGSVTVLGDLAQGTAVAATDSWAATLTHLGKPAARIVPLTTGYRVPAEIVALANRLLPQLASGVEPAASIRRAAGSLAIRPDADCTSVTAAVREALEREGSIAVIAADASVDGLAELLGAARLEATLTGDSPRVTVVPASLAKGLEYDQVIVVEPADVVAAEPRGLHRLYVVLTRAVSRLVVLHSRPLPDALVS